MQNVIRSDLVEIFKTLNGFYNINRRLFFDLDHDGPRGHDKKLFKRIFRIENNYVLVRGRLIGIHYCTVYYYSCAISTFKKHFQFSWSSNPVIIDN